MLPQYLLLIQFDRIPIYFVVAVINPKNEITREKKLNVGVSGALSKNTYIRIKIYQTYLQSGYDIILGGE